MILHQNFFKFCLYVNMNKTSSMYIRSECRKARCISPCAAKQEKWKGVLNIATYWLDIGANFPNMLSILLSSFIPKGDQQDGQGPWSRQKRKLE